jgi:hypothetical protein
VLNDLSSEDGTWVKIFDINLSIENKDRVFRISDYEFVFVDSTPDSASSKPNLKMIIRKRSDKSSQQAIELNGDKI